MLGLVKCLVPRSGKTQEVENCFFNFTKLSSPAYFNFIMLSSPVNHAVVLFQVAPYSPRTFPLSDEEMEKMLKSMPDGHQIPTYSARGLSNDAQDFNSISDSNLNNYDLVSSHTNIYHKESFFNASPC